MIETSFNESTGKTIIVLKPNNSASWRFNMVLFGVMAVFLVSIATYFAALGLWMVFPFAGLEIVALYICLYIRVRANHSKEIITFDDTTLVVERGYNYAEKCWKYQRLLARVFVRQPAYRGHPKQIYIRSHGKDLELGSFLNKSDKELLIKDLSSIIYA